MKVELQDLPYQRIGGGDNLFQSPFWGRFKSLFGWTPRGFHVRSEAGCGSLLVLTRPIAANRCFGYVPQGPDLDLPPSEHGGFLEELSRRLRSELPPECVFLRYDLPWRTPYAEDYGEDGKLLHDALENRYIIPNVEELPAADRRRFTSYIYW